MRCTVALGEMKSIDVVPSAEVLDIVHEHGVVGVLDRYIRYSSNFGSKYIKYIRLKYQLV